MTFSEYFNALYPYISDGEKPMVVLDGMIGHFIYEEAQEGCKLLTGSADTRRRYIQKKNPNPIKPEYAQYAHTNHNSAGFIEWLNDRMYQSDSYDRVEEWLTNSGIEYHDCCAACDNLLSDIFFRIAYPNVTDGSEVKLPDKSPADEGISSQLSENDRSLLTDFHIDFDSILKKCIEGGQSEVWFTDSLSKKIDNLYSEKWKERIPGFEDLGLQSDVLNTIATLQDFCKALDPDSESTGASVRRLRIKLRDNYVKLHPDSYAGLFPYDAFIDDWNEGNEFDM